jgi:hypothetical protein
VYLTGADLAQCSLKSFPNLKPYVQPGGNAYDQQLGVGSVGKANILDYINSKQGTYLGTCAGWFFASDGYYWEGVKYDWPNLLGKYPATEGSIHDIAVYPGYGLTNVTGSGASEQMIYYGGPTRDWYQTSDTSPGAVLLTSTEPNLKEKNMAAAVSVENLLLFAVHAEVLEGIQITGLSTAQRLRNYQFRAREINKATGLDWKAPAAP